MRADDSSIDWQRLLVEARPRAVAALLRSLRDLDAAEEAFQEACLRALKSWPQKGAPKDPVAWLILVGRNAAVDHLRRGKRQQELDSLTSGQLAEEPESGWIHHMDRRPFGDEILRLFFVCCEPCLQRSEQVALALKVVAGLTVAEIARAFLIKPKTLEQRLTRAKRKLGQRRPAYGLPGPDERARRLPTVTTMVYLLFNEGYSASGGDAHVRKPLCEEAIRLARLLLRSVPSEPEVMGLLALCLLQHSRYDARLTASGEIIALDQQDRSRWHRPAIDEGRVMVEKALRRRQPGPLQVQAAIAAVHAGAASSEATDWPEIDRLYQALEQLQPGPVTTLNRAVAVAEHRGPQAALELIDPLAEPLEGYFHFHGVRGALLARLNEPAGAFESWQRALKLARTAAERAHIEARLTKLQNPCCRIHSPNPAKGSSCR